MRAMVQDSGNHHAGLLLRWCDPMGGRAICRAAETGRDQGEWTWVRNRRRKALGPEQDGRNRQWQGNRHGGMEYSPEHRVSQHGRHHYRISKSVSRDRLRYAPSRVRVMHETDRGRSLTFRHGRPFSCSRQGGARHRQNNHVDPRDLQIQKEGDSKF